MTFPKARLAVAACLLVGWISYLGFLVYQTRGMPVLSRPQFMVAQACIVAEVENGSKDVLVKEVIWGDKALTGKQLHLADLGDPKNGLYLMPLIQDGPQAYHIVLVPQVDQARIYPWTAETQAQLKPFRDSKAYEPGAK